MNEKLENFIDFAREGENSRSTRRIFIYTHILKEGRILIYQRSLLWLRNLFFLFFPRTFVREIVDQRKGELGDGDGFKKQAR